MANIELTQKLPIFKKNILVVNDERELIVTRKTLFKSTSFAIPIDHLSGKPIIHKDLNVSWLGMLLIGLVLSAYCVYELSVNQESAGAFAGVVAFIGLVVISGVQAARSYVNLLIFTDSRTRENIFSIKPNKPSVGEVTRFIDQLESRIKSIEYTGTYTADEKNHIYLKHLGFLAQESVITSKEYDEISDRLLNKVNDKIVSIVK